MNEVTTSNYKVINTIFITTLFTTNHNTYNRIIMFAPQVRKKCIQYINRCWGNFLTTIFKTRHFIKPLRFNMPFQINI